jgi:hypothetical protein
MNAAGEPYSPGVGIVESAHCDLVIRYLVGHLTDMLVYYSGSSGGKSFLRQSASERDTLPEAHEEQKEYLRLSWKFLARSEIVTHSPRSY